METKNEVYMVKVPTAMSMFTRGRNRLVEDAIAADAYIKIGRSCLVIIPKLKAYYEGLASCNQ